MIIIRRGCLATNYVSPIYVTRDVVSVTVSGVIGGNAGSLLGAVWTDRTWGASGLSVIASRTPWYYD